eukprot:640152-Prymnesium_polylepis.2
MMGRIVAGSDMARNSRSRIGMTICQLEDEAAAVGAASGCSHIWLQRSAGCSTAPAAGATGWLISDRFPPASSTVSARH